MTRIVVVGPGALGLIFAARLHQAGHDVTLGVRNRTRKASLQNGIQVVGEPRQQVKVTVGPVPCDLVILATKRADAGVSKRWMKRCNGPLVVLQNGLPQELVDDNHAVVHASVWFPASVRAPDVSEQTGPGRVHIATPDRAVGTSVAALLAPVAPVQVHPNVLPVKWSKLLVNSCITGLGAVAGVGLGELLGHKSARTAFLAVVHEGYRVARAEGVQPATLDRFSPRFFAAQNGWLRPAQLAALGVLARRIRRHESSSLQSLQKGEKTEVDGLNGTITKLGKKHAIPTPVNQAIWDLVTAIEAGRATPGLEHLPALNGFTDPGEPL